MINVSVRASVWQLAIIVEVLCAASPPRASAQAPQPSAAEPAGPDVANTPPPATLPDDGSVPSGDAVTRSRSHAIGGGSEAPLQSHHTSPLESVGFGIGGSAYVLTAGVGFVYATTILPLTALFAGAKAQPVLLWLLLPIGGPLFAQENDSLKHKPVLRAFLIGDGVLQGAGLLLGLIGVALSGKNSRNESGFDLSLGVPGSTATGVTIRLRTL